jgi:hypothetical protein
LYGEHPKTSRKPADEQDIRFLLPISSHKIATIRASVPANFAPSIPHVQANIRYIIRHTFTISTLHLLLAEQLLFRSPEDLYALVPNAVMFDSTTTFSHPL